MGQYYLFANLTKSQSMYPSWSMKAVGILGDAAMQHWLALFLLDLGSGEHKKLSLQNLCLKTLCEQEQQYPPALLASLPQHLQEKRDVMYLSQNLVGEWAGDRLILTGDYSEYCPFPPHGEWKECEMKDNLYSLVDESEKFTSSHAAIVYENWTKNKSEIERKLEKFSAGKSYIVANLDKKEYLNPRVYNTAGLQDSVLDFMRALRGGVLSGLLITLTHSTGSGSGDLPPTDSGGMWAGDRITICTREQLEDFEKYRDVSNDEDEENI